MKFVNTSRQHDRKVCLTGRFGIKVSYINPEAVQ